MPAFEGNSFTNALQIKKRPASILKIQRGFHPITAPPLTRAVKAQATLLSRPIEWARGACCLMILLSCAFNTAAAETSSKEDSVRAAFLYRLAFFVTWPDDSFANAQAPINLCVAASTSKQMVRLLIAATAKPIANQRQLTVRVVSDNDSSSGGRLGASVGCHMLFGDAFPNVGTNSAQGQTLLVVSSLAALNQGGHLALVREQLTAGDARLVFYAKRERIANAAFKLSSKLMQLVRFQ